MEEIIKVNGQKWCPQCQRYYDYKEMADEKTCSQCVSRLREVQQVELRKLLIDMHEDDINEVLFGLEAKVDTNNFDITFNK